MKRIVVVGSGVMGRGIAYAAAIAGFVTTVTDNQSSALASAEAEINQLVESGIQRGKLSEQVGAYALANVAFTTSLNTAVMDADLIIEAVPEKPQLKQAVFQLLEKVAKSSCIFATNTSTMSPTEIASYGARPAKTIAMHFFNPVHKMRLIEIVRGLETSDETVESVKEVARRMGKETVVINEFPGFVTSRMSALVGNEAFFMLQEGLGTPEDIDKAIKLGLNYPMGPFELGDLVGLDTRLNNLRYLHEKLGEKYRPAPLLEQYVQAGRLGRKTGKGVYQYNEEEVTT
ncbi:3-hydroxybutyryl-CoA dehydrogenase [Alkalihalobacillus xiaoxiensis]|uniref:3-hydroxybutyryl-CoA dehydrogenase n=1 Tax=Shouchella xiaoxiensis TaxID=766895 RepID=A0ABS2SX24_9BACI|nr:3-hydroxybutyryl-CoA dehydrogenase [Shouchella xiaoxiensis]